MIHAAATTVSFTGHRTYRGEAEEALRAAIAELYARGLRTFMSGMAVGFDLAAAEAVLACRETMPQIELVAVVPFRGQEVRFSAADRARYARILALADRTEVLAAAYDPSCYAVRNRYLVDHASTLITWYDGSPGGTGHTVAYARRCGLEIAALLPAARMRCAPDPVLF